MESNVNIPEKLIELARNCRTPEELIELAKSENIELDDEMLEGIAGGIRMLPIRQGSSKSK